MPERQTVVVKVGTSTLCELGGELDLNFIRALCAQLAEVLAQGHAVVLVSSGAIRAGLQRLGLKRGRELRLQQAAAAVGQPELMRMYSDFLRDRGVVCAQILLTRGDVTSRERYLNARNTLTALLERGVLPIVNENDSVATEEIQFGENDQLAAQVVQLVGADLLVFLTDADGFLMPAPDGGQELLRDVYEVTLEMEAAAGGSRGGLGSGGMVTKLEAARMATRVGARCVICRGKGDDGPPVLALLAGEPRGTCFHPAEQALRGRKRWLAQSARVEGELVLDDGAVAAVTAGGKSLLAVGIRELRGEFDAGALLRLLDPAGREIARGLSNYPSREIALIRGLRSTEIAKALGYRGDAAVIHRDNLALTEARGGPPA